MFVIYRDTNTELRYKQPYDVQAVKVKQGYDEKENYEYETEIQCVSYILFIVNVNRLPNEKGQLFCRRRKLSIGVH